MEVDRRKNLDELEELVWGEPTYNSSLVRTCHALRRKPIGEFTVEDLRIMLGQEIGVRHLLPLAIEVLVRDPLAEGDYYPGDLLENVMRLPDSSWEPALREALVAALRAPREWPEMIAPSVAAFLRSS